MIRFDIDLEKDQQGQRVKVKMQKRPDQTPSPTSSSVGKQILTNKYTKRIKENLPSAVFEQFDSQCLIRKFNTLKIKVNVR